MTPVNDKWWFVTIVVLMVCSLVAAFIPGFRPVLFFTIPAAALIYVFAARRKARGDGR